MAAMILGNSDRPFTAAAAMTIALSQLLGSPKSYGCFMEDLGVFQG
jgi:hypothetical protein